MIVDTHIHLDGEEFDADRDEVIARARQAGVGAMLIPAIDLHSSRRIIDLCSRYSGYLYPMTGLHPEEVHADFREQLSAIHSLLPFLKRGQWQGCIGEVGLDFYWSREFEREQIEAFEVQVQWSVETGLPLMIHCRKAQNEMVHILKAYARELPGGVFHCFTGNEHEAAELLQFERFVLGVGGVFTFKKSHLPKVLPAAVPLDRLVLETDAPYMAPVPMRGQRNESAYLVHVVRLMAEAYGITEEALMQHTTDNVARVFGQIVQ